MLTTKNTREDNAAHVEVTREIARRFNHLYGPVFPVPELVSADVPTLVGTDGQTKMSKSLGNVISLCDTPAEVTRKVMGMYTDPNRIRADIPGRVEGNPVFIYHDVFNPDTAEIADLKQRYTAGRVGGSSVAAPRGPPSTCCVSPAGAPSPSRSRRHRGSAPTRRLPAGDPATGDRRSGERRHLPRAM